MTTTISAARLERNPNAGNHVGDERHGNCGRERDGRGDSDVHYAADPIEGLGSKARSN